MLIHYKNSLYLVSYQVVSASAQVSNADKHTPPNLKLTA